MLRGINHGVAKTVKIVLLQGDVQMEETGPVVLPLEGEPVAGPLVWPSPVKSLA